MSGARADRAIQWVFVALFFACVVSFSLRFDHTEFLRVHADGAHAYVPQGVYVPDWLSANYEPFSGGRLTPGYWLSVAIYSAMTVLAGMGVLAPLFRRYRLSLAGWIGSGYLIGYLLLVAQNRLITLLLPIDLARTAITWSSPFLVLFAWLWADAFQKDGERSPELSARAVGRVAIGLGIAGAVAFFFVVFQVQFGRNYMSADSTIFFLRYLDWALNSGHAAPHFPLVDQQYDEIMYAFPLIYSEAGRRVFLFAFWILDGIGKASAACFLFSLLSIRLHGKKRLFAALAVIFVFCGTPDWLPSAYISLFGGQNPLIHNGHIGRMLGVILIWFWIEFFPCVDFSRVRRARWVYPIILGLLGVGLGATSVSNLLFAGAAIAVSLFLWSEKKTASPLAWPKPSVSAGIALLLVAGPIVTYAITGPAGGSDGYLLFVSGCAGLAVCLWLLLARKTQLFRRPLLHAFVPPVAMLAVASVSCVIFGNVFAKNFMDWVQAHEGWRGLLPGVYWEPMLERGVANLGSARLFVYGGCSSPSQHCLSSGYFGAYYGLTLFAAATTLVWAYRLRQRRILFLGVFFLTAFSFALFCTDFIESGTLEWVRIRLVEVPFYGIFCLAAIAAGQGARGLLRWLIAGVFAIWGLSAFLVNGGLEQWWMNLRYLISSL